MRMYVIEKLLGVVFDVYIHVITAYLSERMQATFERSAVQQYMSQVTASMSLVDCSVDAWTSRLCVQESL